MFLLYRFLASFFQIHFELSLLEMTNFTGLAHVTIVFKHFNSKRNYGFIRSERTNNPKDRNVSKLLF